MGGRRGYAVALLAISKTACDHAGRLVSHFS